MTRKPAFVMVFFVAAIALAAAAIGQPAASAQDMGATVQWGSTDELGAFLVDSAGMTLYVFANDAPDVSNCSGDCLVNWPPLLVDEGQIPTLAEGIPGRLGVIQRPDDGTFQVAYNGWPLYYWVNDAAPGDTTGHNVGDVWFVAKPADVSLGGNDELGPFLVGPNGMTLYIFTNDAPGVSNCYDNCAVNWPPLLVPASQQPTAGEGVTGALGVTERTDGTFQVTYDEMPLYYWIRDVVPGDATGQNVGEVWFVINVEGAMMEGGTEGEMSEDTGEDMGEESMGAALDGNALVSERCTVCHTRERIDAASKDRAGWEATVDRMIGYGAQLNADERQAVIDYLSSQ
jgi:predicted lipoprotein with Yx(FWY)xxD motif